MTRPDVCYGITRGTRIEVNDSGRLWPWLLSNSGSEVKLSLTFLAGPTVLSAFGLCPPHDGAW